jgi:hypothetical protein
MRWAGHTEYMGVKQNAYRILFLWKNQKESNHYKKPGECGRKILKWIFEKYAAMVWTGLSGSG